MKKLYLFLALIFLIILSGFSWGQIGIHSDIDLSDQSAVDFLSQHLLFQNGVVQSPNGEVTIYFSPNLNWEGASDRSHSSTYIAVDNHENLIFPLRMVKLYNL